jgi:hypothetical protein
VFFYLIKKGLSTQPQMTTRAIWDVKAACVHDANHITTDKKLMVKKNMVTNTTFHYAPQGVTGILTLTYIPLM